MTRLRQRRTSGTTAGGSTPTVGSPGKRTLTDGVRMRQAKAEGPAAAGGGEVAPAAGGGAALPGGVQDKMEQSFGTSFGDVRVHEGPQAAALGAQAYAEGSDVHFAPGKYDPDSAGGQELLGHELAHVVQQRAGRVETPQGKDEGTGDGINTDPALEAEADTAGANAAQGLPATADGAAAASPLDSHGTPDAGAPETVHEAKGFVNAADTELVRSTVRRPEVVTTLANKTLVEITHDAGNYYKVAGVHTGYILRGRVTIGAVPEETAPEETAPEEPKAADPYAGLIAKSTATMPIEDGGTFYHLPSDFGLQMVMRGCNLGKQLLAGMGSNEGWLRKKVGPCFKAVGWESRGPSLYAMVINPDGHHFIARTAVHAHTVLKDGSTKAGDFPGALEGFWIHPDWEKRMEAKK